MAHCPRCNTPSVPNQPFCSRCGQALAPAAPPPPAAPASACQYCRAPLPAGYTICANCAARMQPQAPPASACQYCRAPLPAGYTICAACAARQHQQPAPAPAPRPGAFCTGCGAALPAGYSICAACAARQRPQPAPAPAPSAQQPPAYAQQQPTYAQQQPAYAQQPPAYAQQPPAYPQQPPAYARQQPPAAPPKSGHGCRNTFLVLLALALMVLVAGGGIALWYYWDDLFGGDSGGAGSTSAPPPDVTPLDPADTLIPPDKFPPPPKGNPHAGYDSPPIDTEPVAGVRLTAPAGALDQPRTFRAERLAPADLRPFRQRLEARATQAVAGIRLDGGMGSDDRLRRPLTVEFDLARLGVDPDLWGWTGVQLAGDDGTLREVPVERRGGTLSFRTHHNLVGLLVVGATLISGALYLKADAESAEETEGIEWNGIISRSGKFNILWPKSLYNGNDRTREAFAQLEALWRHRMAGTLPPGPAPGVPGPYANQQRLIEEIQAIEREFKGGWLRDEWAWPGALCVEDELEYAYTYLTTTRGFKPLDQRINVYLRKPWKKQAGALGLFEGALTRRAWLSINLDKAGTLTRTTDLGATADGVNLQVTILHELFHGIQSGYVTGNDTLWCVEAAAVVLEQEIKTLYEARSSAGISLTPLLTKRDTLWPIYRRPLDVGGTVVGLIRGVEMLQQHGYGASFFLEDVKRHSAGGANAFLPGYMTALERTGGGAEALVKMAVSSGRLGRLYTDFSAANADAIWSMADPDTGKNATVLDAAAKPRHLLRAVDVHPLSTPCYTVTVPDTLTRAKESAVVFFQKDLKASGITVQVRATSGPRWRELAAPVDTQRFAFSAAAGRAGQCPVQVIGGFVHRDYTVQNKASLAIVVLIPPQQPPSLPGGAKLDLFDLKPDGKLEVRWARSKLDRCDEFAGYRLRIEIRTKAGRAEQTRDVPPKRDRIEIPWSELLPPAAFDVPEDSIELRISQAEVLAAQPKIVGPYSDPAVLVLDAFGAELKTYEGRMSLLGGDRTYEKFTYYPVTSKTPKSWQRGFFPPGHPNVWMGSAVTWRWVVEANGGNHANKVIHGPYLMKYTNGRVCCEAVFKYGKLNGPFKVYHESGGLAGSGNYTDGFPDGQFPEWWIDGSLSRTETWEKGKKIKTDFPDKKKK